MCEAPSRSGIRPRLVTTTAEPAVPGSSGATWAAALAPSARTSTRLPASSDRYSASRSNLVTGRRSAGRPSPRSSSPSTACGSRGRPPSSKHAYSWPSGNREHAICAACTASAVLPVPSMPVTTATVIPSPDRRPSRRARGTARPMSAVTAIGSWRAGRHVRGKSISTGSATTDGSAGSGTLSATLAASAGLAGPGVLRALAELTALAVSPALLVLPGLAEVTGLVALPALVVLPGLAEVTGLVALSALVVLPGPTEVTALVALPALVVVTLLAVLAAPAVSSAAPARGGRP